MHTLFGEMNEMDLDQRVVIDRDVPAPVEGAQYAVDYFKATEWYVKSGPNAGQLARRDQNVVLKPAVVGAAPGVFG